MSDKSPTTMDQLHALYQKRQEAKQLCDALGMTNTSGLSPEKQVELDVRSRAAWLDFEDAARAYDDLLDFYARERINA